MEDLQIPSQLQSDFLKYLKDNLDDLCERIAEKFGLFDGAGRPRKAYILNVLTRYACPCCAVYALTQMREKADVDAIFHECHDLAVSLLTHTLRDVYSNNMHVSNEASGEYGRVDVLIQKLDGTPLLVRIGAQEVIVEVKTNKGLGLKQVLRYLLERPEAVAVIWRVRKRQVLVVDGREHRWLLALFAAVTISQALTVLSGEYSACRHSKPRSDAYELDDPKGFLDEFLASLADGLPNVVSTVIGLLNKGSPGHGKVA